MPAFEKRNDAAGLARNLEPPVEGSRPPSIGLLRGFAAQARALRPAPPNEASADVAEVPVGPAAAPEVTPEPQPADPTANKAVTALPDTAPAEERPLTPPQVARARTYYWNHQKPVLADIRQKVGLSPEGTADEAMVQAVARFQAKANRTRRPDPPLAVDGMAGPRTLPILAPVGLAQGEQVDAFAKGVLSSEEAITAAPDFVAKAALFGKLINDRLIAVGVPPAIVVPDEAVNQWVPGPEEDLPGWVLRLSHRTLSYPKGEAAIAYHEARHAEQSWMIARMLAGRGHSAARVAEEAPAPPHVAAAAVAQPLAPDSTEAKQAAGWHELEPGHKPLHELQQERSSAALAFVVAVHAHDRSPSSTSMAKVTAAYERWKAANQAERNTPTEYDAHFVEDRVSDWLGVAREGFPSLEDQMAAARKLDPKDIPT